MAKVILKFDERVLDECVIGHRGVKIGRLPDNQIVIDNPAVSGHHARVFMEGDRAILEDLQSTNGTFINNKPIARHVLEHGDVALIGKHTITYDGLSVDIVEDAREAGPAVPDLGGTRMLETEQHKTLLKKWEQEAQQKKPAAVAPAAPAPAAPPAGVMPSAPGTLPKTERTQLRNATLRVLAGRTDRSEYDVSAHTSLIGKSNTALVRLRGWFKPKAAAAIARKGDGFAVTPLSGKTTLNGQPLTTRADLKDGDVLQVSGVTLEFRLKS